ncbi:MAG: trypsin-like peptidase domain-containing protein [Oscillospiraceae bacterium]|nr:trypsin-like peptidase domain-containing protein [Oscillospiraceae bacterium]
MDLYSDREFDPIPQNIPEAAAEDFVPAAEPEAETAWHGTGAGVQETIFAAPTEPEESIPEAEPVFESAPVYERTYTPQPEEYTVPKRRERKPGMGKRILAAVLSAALVIGSCAVTAGIVNNRWENRMLELQTQMNEQYADLQEQIQQAQSGISISGSPMASQGGMSPSQVYAMNVNSVVAISNQTTTNVWGQISETASSGTGFIISADGYILSNYHVVEGANKLTVITYMGDEYEAKLVGFDKMNDVSILKVEATGLEPVTIGSSDDLIVGDQVVAIGNPLGELTSSLTVGYISAKDRTINTDGSLINMMQTDAAINPGNSGGPLFNMKGEVVGITTAKYSGSTGSGASIEGIGFAIPIADVMAMSEDLIAHGYLTNQAYLGVSVMDLDGSTASMYSLPVGSYVQSVTEGSCAERAGIQPKDIIIKVGDYTVEGNSTLQSALRKFRAGETTTITVYRAGAELELTITFDERPQDPDAEQQAQQQPQQSGEMPNSGSYEDWYNYFFPFFGGGMP